MKRVPTDLKILKCIFDRYYAEFSSFEKSNPSRESKVYVCIDIREIAISLKTDPDIVFGRLYYYMEDKYRLVKPNGSEVNFFRFVQGVGSKERHQVQFPMLVSVLASLQESNARYFWPLLISVISLIFSLCALLPAFLQKGGACQG